jgi:hypothetical protein
VTVEERREVVRNARATGSILHVLFGALLALTFFLLLEYGWRTAFGVGIVALACEGLALLAMLGAAEVEEDLEA